MFGKATIIAVLVESFALSAVAWPSAMDSSAIYGPKMPFSMQPPRTSKLTVFRSRY
jgi:hypothetical protein